jgi:MFS transporter, SP family, sugar:H+ symporter
LGIFVALLLDYVLAHVAGGSDKPLALGQVAWRWMFLSMAVPAVIYGALPLPISESPRYLVSQGWLDDAKQVLSRVPGKVDLEAKVAEIRRTLSTDRPRLADIRAPALGLMPIM